MAGVQVSAKQGRNHVRSPNGHSSDRFAFTLTCAVLPSPSSELSGPVPSSSSAPVSPASPFSAASPSTSAGSESTSPSRSSSSNGTARQKHQRKDKERWTDTLAVGTDSGTGFLGLSTGRPRGEGRGLGAESKAGAGLGLLSTRTRPNRRGEVAWASRLSSSPSSCWESLSEKNRGQGENAAYQAQVGRCPAHVAARPCANPLTLEEQDKGPWPALPLREGTKSRQLGVCSHLHHSAWIRAVCRAGQGCGLTGRTQTRLFRHTGEGGGSCKGPFWT